MRSIKPRQPWDGRGEGEGDTRPSPLGATARGLALLKTDHHTAGAPGPPIRREGGHACDAFHSPREARGPRSPHGGARALRRLDDQGSLPQTAPARQGLSSRFLSWRRVRPTQIVCSQRAAATGPGPGQHAVGPIRSIARRAPALGLARRLLETMSTRVRNENPRPRTRSGEIGRRAGLRSRLRPAERP